MVSIEGVGSSGATGRPSKRLEEADFSAVNFVQASSFQASASIKSALLKILNSNDRLQTFFEKAFRGEMKKAADSKLEITPENGMHVALYDTIVQNRGLFPNQAFTIKTELPGGGSIETQIEALSPSSQITGYDLSDSTTKLAALINGL